MKLTKTLLLFTAVTALALTSCKKDTIQDPSQSNLNNVASSLKAPAIVYNVSAVEWFKVDASNIGNLLLAFKKGKETNAGTFSFNVDSTGSYSIKIDGQVKAGKFRWRESLILKDHIYIYPDYDFNPNSSYFNEFVMLSPKIKDKQYWKGIQTESANTDPLHGKGTALISLLTLTK